MGPILRGGVGRQAAERLSRPSGDLATGLSEPERARFSPRRGRFSSLRRRNPVPPNQQAPGLLVGENPACWLGGTRACWWEEPAPVAGERRLDGQQQPNYLNGFGDRGFARTSPPPTTPVVAPNRSQPRQRRPGRRRRERLCSAPGAAKVSGSVPPDRRMGPRPRNRPSRNAVSEFHPHHRLFDRNP